MKWKSYRFDVKSYVHWILFIALAMGILGASIQLVRYGAILESGSIGPTGE